MPIVFTLGYALLVFKHRSNLIKLKKGEENKAVEILKESGEEAYVMGEVIKADGGVVFA